MSEVVDINIPYLLANMEWEGIKILSGFSVMTAPPGSPAGHKFYKHFHTLPDGRSLRLVARLDDSLDYVDWWFFHYWGHTGTSQITWPLTAVPDAITIEGTEFFQWGDGRPVRVGEKFAQGHCMVDRIRQTFTAYGVWTTSDVTNAAVNTGNLVPNLGHTPAPSWCTVKATTLSNEFSKNNFARDSEQDNREQFRENAWVQAKTDVTGDQERFGSDHFGVAKWAESPTGETRYERAWWMVLRKHMNQGGNWVHPVTGLLPDFKSSAYNKLVMVSHGLDERSDGFNRGVNQNWFDFQNWGGSNAYAWQARDPVSNERWGNFNQEHWGVTHLCQYYDRYKDPGAWVMIESARMRWLASWPNEDRGPNLHYSGSHRARGRGIQDAVAMYLLDPNTDLLDAIKYRLTQGLAQEAQNGLISGSGNDPDTSTHFSAWMTGIWAMGLIAATENGLVLGGTLQGRAEAQVLRVAQRVLRCWWESSPGVWSLPYTSDAAGDPNGPSDTRTSSLWLWSFGSLMWLWHHHRSNGNLSGAEVTKLEAIFTYRYTNASGTANLWPEQWEWFYWPTAAAPKTATAAFTIPVPTFQARAIAVASPDPTLKIGDAAFTIPIPTFVGVGGRTRIGPAAFTIPIPTFEGHATAKPAAIQKIGSGHFTIPIPTIAASGKVHITVFAAFTIPIPTFTASVTLTFFSNSERRHTGDGSTTTFSIDMGYLSTTHLTVKVDSVAAVDGSYIFDSTGANIVFLTAPANGLLIQIIRATPHPKPIVEFTTNASVTPDALNRALRQLMYYAEEVDDKL